MDKADIGELRMFNDGNGWYVAKLCPMNTSNPDPNNAFWQQVSKCYKYEKYARDIWSKMLNKQIFSKLGI